MSAALRRGALLAALSAVAACATQAPTPAPPKVTIAQPDLSAMTLDPAGWRPVTDFATRLVVPGASVLPPYGVRWSVARFTTDRKRTVGVGFRAPAQGGRAFVAAVVSTPITPEDWQALHSVDASVFGGAVRLGIAEGWPRVRGVTVSQAGGALCADFHGEVDKNLRASAGVERRGVAFLTGRTCLHPEAPRMIWLMAAQWTPEASTPLSIESEVAPFLESLKFLPLGVARTIGSRPGVEMTRR